ncbi:unnamed protein product [Citrullus colocynthis]|uniref:Uncharacterized protein n=1 Tax=Citrullus colocynthis TaxID=252529 RepID=A0ABP0Y053_9ROSI
MGWMLYNEKSWNIISAPPASQFMVKSSIPDPGLQRSIKSSVLLFIVCVLRVFLDLGQFLTAILMNMQPMKQIIPPCPFDKRGMRRPYFVFLCPLEPLPGLATMLGVLTDFSATYLVVHGEIHTRSWTSELSLKSSPLLISTSTVTSSFIQSIQQSHSSLLVKAFDERASFALYHSVMIVSLNLGQCSLLSALLKRNVLCPLEPLPGLATMLRLLNRFQCRLSCGSWRNPHQILDFRALYEILVVECDDSSRNFLLQYL